MRFRTLALALALACASTAMVEAKTNRVHKVSVKKNRRAKSSKANRVKPRKAKLAKRHVRRSA